MMKSRESGQSPAPADSLKQPLPARKGSTDRMHRDKITRFRAAHPPGPLPHTPVRPISCRFMPFHPAFNRFVFLSGIVFLRPKPKPRIFRTSRDENTYAFAYDSFARLTDTRHYEAGALTDRFAEKGLTYDANGNLRTLMRTGNGLTLNDLEYSYTGNRIASIADAGAVYDYGYDANGNMTHDGANDLDITYNCLNMTQKVEKKGLYPQIIRTLQTARNFRRRSQAATDSIIRVLWYMGNVTENYRSKARGSTEAGSSRHRTVSKRIFS